MHMASLTEEQLVQMVRDYIEIESETVSTSKGLSENCNPRCLRFTLQVSHLSDLLIFHFYICAIEKLFNC